MPILLEPKDVAADLEGVQSVLIVSCMMCPPISLAMEQKKPFIEFFKHGLKTQVFEEYVKSIREPLEQRGVRTAVYAKHLPSPFVCLWTVGQRRRFLDRAKDFEMVLVLGCKSATNTIEGVLEGTGCRVVQAMRMKGIANAIVRTGSPGEIYLDKLPPRQKPKDRRHEEHESG